MVLFPQLFPALLLKVTGYIARPRLPFTLSISSLPFVWLHGVSVKFLLCAAVDLSVQFALNEKRKKEKTSAASASRDVSFTHALLFTLNLCENARAISLHGCPFSKPTGFR